MNQEFIISDNLVKYILFQRTGLLRFSNLKIFTLLNKYSPWSFYEKAVAWEASIRKRKIKAMFQEEIFKEYESIKEYLPEKCNSILDIGCGIAAIDIYLLRHYNQSKQIILYLFDKSTIEKRIFYNFKDKGAFYNSLQIAHDFLVENQVYANNINLLEVPENGHIAITQGLDLVISMISWGFHYPVSTYLEQVYNLLNEGGRLILDVRNDTGGEKEINDKFSSVVKISQHQKSTRLLAIK